MKLLFLLVCLGLVLYTQGERTSFFGTLTSVRDCDNFNNHEGSEFARAVVSPQKEQVRGRGIWRLSGPALAQVEDCYKRVTKPNKTVIFTVTKGFEKLKSFPRGPGILQLNVGKGPNAPDNFVAPPSVVDDGSFEGVIFGLYETENGTEKYTEKHIATLIKHYNSDFVRSTRFIWLNGGLVKVGPKAIFKSLLENGISSVLVYQDEQDLSTDISTISGNLDPVKSVFMIQEKKDKPRFERAETDEAQTTTPKPAATTTGAEDGTGGTEDGGNAGTDDGSGGGTGGDSGGSAEGSTASSGDNPDNQPAGSGGERRTVANLIALILLLVSCYKL